MDNRLRWEYKHIQLVKEYEVALENFSGNEDQFLRVRNQLDQSIKEFLEALETVGINPFTKELMGHHLKFSIGDQNKILVESLDAPDADSVWLDLSRTGK